MQHLWRLGSDAVGVAVVQRSGSAVPGKKVLRARWLLSLMPLGL